MKRLLITLSLSALALYRCSAGEWLTDLPAALVQAKAENKSLLLDFTGSDWCGWCKRLKSEVFDQPEFTAYAQANLILVEVDFPRHKSQSSQQKQANNALGQKYGIRGFPTIVLLDAAGERLGTTGYQPGGPDAFISQLRNILGVRSSAAPAKASNHAEAPPAPSQVPAAPAAPAPPVLPSGLFLKGLSGASGQRLALINNQTIMAGETARVKVGGGAIEVTVKSIATDSAVITAQGQTFELKLTSR